MKTYVFRPLSIGNDCLVTRHPPFMGLRNEGNIELELNEVAADWAKTLGLIIKSCKINPAIEANEVVSLDFELGTGRSFVVFIKPENWE